MAVLSERILDTFGDKYCMLQPMLAVLLAPPVDVIMRQRIGMDVMKNIVERARFFGTSYFDKNS